MSVYRVEVHFTAEADRRGGGGGGVCVSGDWEDPVTARGKFERWRELYRHRGAAGVRLVDDPDGRAELLAAWPPRGGQAAAGAST